MPNVNVTLKENASPEELANAKKVVQEQGGEIINEFKLIKGFTASFPADKVSILESNEHIHVEPDAEVKTQ
ncbi:hypothetical protein L228DRAFT_282225 [Xylona heveae TC161]|uniref:Inhibitor I9 domain-containing protein n=1 Tax=Xylona heveae (strain CBS 132557 / TC161) TaxID=1328760 RepID=A0A165HH18_XYLHT|nr:hypothetical protein L228DRAFT_282225 [Xylona heveae TC161]KZF23503.1 hypothetical protein L228DRAFT_282225 [Xylona heveae TC161]